MLHSRLRIQGSVKDAQAVLALQAPPGVEVSQRKLT